MRFYKITNDEGDEKPTYKCTKTDAHNKLKELKVYPGARIELVEISTDQATLADAFSGWGFAESVLQTWKLTPRGGLIECPNGE